ncbi:MAG: hypothetical protein HY216_03315 [Candidatus Rokubacteria bacterium]|nr:hypothetical protein [Candidatus Rokubacteria bacterium]
MNAKRGALLLATLVSLSACTTAPNVMVLPGVGKPFEEFQRDDVICRQWAAGPSVRDRYDIAYQQCMYARGNQIPGVVPASRPSGTPSPPATRP